jgi:hypothetical protein
MCFRVLDCTMFVQKPTDIEYRDGHFHLAVQIGENATIRLVYSPSVFIASLLAGEVALASFQAEATNAPRNVHELYPVRALTA